MKDFKTPKTDTLFKIPKTDTLSEKTDMTTRTFSQR